MAISTKNVAFEAQFIFIIEATQNGSMDSKIIKLFENGLNPNPSLDSDKKGVSKVISGVEFGKTHPKIQESGVDWVWQSNHHASEPSSTAANKSWKTCIHWIIEPSHPVPCY